MADLSIIGQFSDNLRESFQLQIKARSIVGPPSRSFGLNLNIFQEVCRTKMLNGLYKTAFMAMLIGVEVTCHAQDQP
jgi:hypothetical protein